MLTFSSTYAENHVANNVMKWCMVKKIHCRKNAQAMNGKKFANLRLLYGYMFTRTLELKITVYGM
jgi:hypothetical protein